MKTFSESILENLKSIMVVLDEKGNLEYISSSVKNVLGYNPEQLLGGSWYNIAVSKEYEFKSLRTGILKLSKNKNIFQNITYEQQLRTIHGKEKWILWSASKEDNKLIAIGQDISELKKTEALLLKKNTELFLKNKETKQSIEYASRLQSAIMPENTTFKECFKDSFIFNLPKDIIGGDYCFIYKVASKVIVALVDCTGHGVPGALLSVLAHSLLKEVIVNRNVIEPSEILYELDRELFKAINSKKDNSTNFDGMDVAIGVFDQENNILSFSGAFRPILLVRNNETYELKPNRYPIGFYADIKKEFITQTISLRERDLIYFFSDGYIDQFGGECLKKFNKKRFKELLLFVQNMEMEEQESFLSYALNNWKQNEPQVDDILIIGIKI